MARDRDVRAAVRAALLQTGMFDEVHPSEPEAFGFGASEGRAAIVEPMSWADQDLYDGGPATGGIVTNRLRLTFLARNPDPELCDAAAEDLVQYARVALNGQALVPGFVFPDRCKVGDGTWLPRTSAERRIQAEFRYAYEYGSWSDFDTAE